MLLWIGFALLTAAVVGSFLRALSRGDPGGKAAPDAESNLAVYKDQLTEIELDRARGLIGGAEAEAARAEVARRVLTSARALQAPLERAPSALGRKATLAAVALIPIASLVAYLMLGSPGLPGQPLAQRSTPSIKNAAVEELVAKVEARLREHPEDGKGWDVIAPVYLRIGRYSDAANAYAHSMRIGGESVPRLMGFAQATMLASQGVVSEPVRKSAERILVLEPGRIEPRVWLALAREQDGDKEGALAEYRAMLASAPADAPWRGALEERIAVLEGRPPPPVAAGEGPGSGAPGSPSAAAPAGTDEAAVEAMSPEARAEFIETMVSRLASRLEEDGSDLEGWQKLVRAYQVLGRNEEAAAALAKARSRFASDAAAMTTLDELARSLGIKG